MPDFTEEDRRDSILALNARLKPTDLRRMIPLELARLVTKVERRDGLYDPRIPDVHLATFLIDLYGPELLRERKVRRILVERATDEEIKALYRYGNPPSARGKARHIECVVTRKWQAGKSWPHYFVRTLGLPESLAGSPDGGEAPAFEDVEPYIPLPPLHIFQQTLRQEVEDTLLSGAGRNRGILSLPTGAGKTRTVVEAVTQGWRRGALPGRFVLWIAQSDELCEQAVTAFREVWTDQSVRALSSDRQCPQEPLRLFRLWASRSVPDAAERGVVIASIQKLERLCKSEDPDILAFFEAIGTVIVDEAHHAIAPSYSQVFWFLGLAGRRSDSERPMIGLTATPYRGSNEETHRLVQRFYGRLITPGWEDPIARLRNEGILARMTTSTVSTGRRFELNASEQKHVETFRDLPDTALHRIGNDQQRNARIMQELINVSPDWPVLFFGCSVNHARAMALLLRRANRTAAAVTAETPRSLRRAWINDFRAGRLQFLCNYGVLTTGFDAPQVRVVVVARPTSSVLLYEQMVGRGMRGPSNGGKEECLVIDMVDVIPQFGEQMSYQRYADLWMKKPALPAVGQSDG